MSLGLVGRKVGMTRIFTGDGDSLPVTVLDVSNNRVTQIKTPDTDGYSAVQVTFGKRRPIRVNKPAAGHFAKAAVEAGHVLKEFRVKPEVLDNLKPGAVISLDIFQTGQRVDVTGTSIGKGYAGVIKRHGFSSNRASHGNSSLIMFRVPSAWPRIPVAYFPVSGCLGISEACSALPRTLKSCGWTRCVVCCSLRAQFQDQKGGTSWCIPA